MPRTESRLPSPERRDQFIQLIKAGNYASTALAFVGIPERSLYAWKAEAAQPDARPAVVQFMQSVREAEAVAEASLVQVVQRSAHGGDYRAAALILERRWPNRWGRHDRHELAVHPVVPATTARTRLAAALDRLGAELAADLAPPPIEVAEAPPPIPLHRPAAG